MDIPAFPNITTNGSDSDAGMGLRDYFAAKAMQGALSDADFGAWSASGAAQIAKNSYIIADAMIAARASKTCEVAA